MTENQAVIALANLPQESKTRIPAKLISSLEDSGAEHYKAIPYTIDKPHVVMVTLYLPKRLGSGIIAREIVNTKTGSFC